MRVAAGFPWLSNYLTFCIPPQRRRAPVIPAPFVVLADGVL
jgi:hypothetical protein